MVDPMSVNYNLTALSNISVLDAPADAIVWWNSSLGGFAVFTLLAVIGLILFLAMRKFVDSDSEAIGYSSFIMTIVGIFLFVIETSSGDKILSWPYLIIIIIITAISNFLNFINRRF